MAPRGCQVALGIGRECRYLGASRNICGIGSSWACQGEFGGCQGCIRWLAGSVGTQGPAGV